MAQVSKSAIICKDRTPAFCKGKAKFCTQPKAKKTMSYKCQKTCGFCEVVEKQAHEDVVEDSNEQKFGPWGAKWSRCVRGKKISVVYIGKQKNFLYYELFKKSASNFHYVIYSFKIYNQI